ncbi:GntR family transcriptional regulator [Williamsia sp. 1138]|uniref:GntR family transcriptional regulator n=1 Tax=Williamsia sp. 1138 TaxID=1903117 RepID=UPI000A1058F5|nr:GntR family transcriptional regulator [Williamsia sp. 1138]OZG26145.1 GntR family transcriptional regulator [Williamsia sp. 1138]
MTSTKSADRAYDVIRLQILNGTLQAGARIVEAELARDLNSSRTPVREALRRLEAEGLVEVLPHRGARVTGWTADDLREIYDLRSALEALAGDRAASLITPSDLVALDGLCDHMEEIGSESNIPARDHYSRLNNEFHEIIREASGSVRLVAMLHGVVGVPLIVRTFHLYQEADMHRSSMHHREIVSALRAGDGVWAGSVLRAHVLAAKFTLLGNGSATADLQ